MDHSSKNAVSKRLGRALALFVSAPLTALPAMAQEKTVRIGGEKTGVRRTVSGRIETTTTSVRVGIRVNKGSGFRIDRTLTKGFAEPSK